MENRAYIVDGIRTPIGKFRGGLSLVRADDLAAVPLKYLADKYQGLPVDDIFMGCANQAGEDNRNVARMASLLSGWPDTVPAETVNRLCASGMSAAIHGQRAIVSGDADLIIAGGIEHMTRAPYVMSKSANGFGNDAQLYDSSFGWRFINPRMKSMYGTEAMGETAENLYDKYGISREEQDEFAYQSQMKAAAAQSSGRFDREIIPVEIHDRKSTSIFRHDEFIKPDTTTDILASLRPAFRKDGTVTAGNASGLNDGAAAMLLASQKAVETYGWSPLASIVASANVGVHPSVMGIGPVEASRKALKKAGLSFDDMDIIEINEAFAVQALACLKEWNLDFSDTRINPNGGAIALGHPLGMTGARILYSAALELHLTGKRYALVTMCIGVGQGFAVILERYS
jgi:3-oxoadipyl-CoA thiolase